MFYPRLLFVFCSIAAMLGGAELEIKREIILAPHAGDTPEDREIRRRQDRVVAQSEKREAYEELAWAFVAKARCTLDAGFYKLAEITTDVIAEKFGLQPETRLLRAHVLHQLHRFAEAESEARMLVRERGAPEDFGLLSDALIERGDLNQATEALQQMVNLRPGAEALSRISWVRWLKGDVRGAIAAMEGALRATHPREHERRAWMLARLAGLYLGSGDLDRAQADAAVAKDTLRSYPPALFVSGRVAWGRGDVEDAVRALGEAARLNPSPEYQWWLADVLRASGRVDEAVGVEQDLRKRGEAADPRTLALYLATRGENVHAAVRLARAELAERRDVFTHDALAWALAASGECASAEQPMRAALAEGTLDARLFLHAGEIALARGRGKEAASYFERARACALSLTPSEATRLQRRLTAIAAQPAPDAERTAQNFYP